MCVWRQESEGGGGGGGGVPGLMMCSSRFTN